MTVLWAVADVALLLAFGVAAMTLVAMFITGED